MKLHEVLNVVNDCDVDIDDQHGVTYWEDEPIKDFETGSLAFKNEKWYKDIKDCTVTNLYVTRNDHDRSALWITIQRKEGYYK